MKTYGRFRPTYARPNTQVKNNVVEVCNFKQFCEQTEWINKGLIQKKVQEYAKYIELKKELKAKGLI